MTASRRQFTFGALMLALAGKARAGGIAEVQQQQALAPNAPSEPSGPPVLEPQYAVRRTNGELQVDLSLANRGEAADILLKWGSRLAPRLLATIEIEGERLELAPVVDVDRRELMSRMGPRPHFAPIAKQGELDIGTYRFAWVDGVPDLPVRLTLSVETADGMLELGSKDVSWKPAGT